MPDISNLLFQLIEQKGRLHVSNLLGHDSTRIIERWQKEGEVPKGKRWEVGEMLKAEGLIQ